MISLKEQGRGSNPPKDNCKITVNERVKGMSFEDFNFTVRTQCPNCKTGMIIIDNKVISCPLCELKRKEKTEVLKKKGKIGITRRSKTS